MIIEKTENGIYKMLDLSEIPKKRWGDREFFCWEQTQNHSIPFIYNDEQGTLSVSYYKHKEKPRILLSYGGRELVTTGYKLRQIDIGSLFYKRIPEYFHHLIVNSEDKASTVSKHKVRCACPACGRERMIKTEQLVHQGFSCDVCRDSMSIPEKTVLLLLESGGIKYIKEYRPPELKGRRIDFYLPEFETCIEVHGGQHYRAVFGEENFLKTMKSDESKRHFCRLKNLRLLEIDSRSGKVEDIANRLLKALPTHLKNKIDIHKVDAIKKEIYTTPDNLLIKRKYLEGKTTIEIAEEMGVSHTTISNKLKGLSIRRRGVSRQVVNLNYKTLFSSLKEADNSSGADYRNIQACCKKRAKSAGKHPVTGEPLKWMYYEDYIEKYGTEGLTEYIEEPEKQTN